MLESNVNRLSDLSSGTLKEVASIASRFDEHGRVLASASDLLNAAQSSLSNTLDDRQEALENLSVGLVSRSEEIEKNLRSFESPGHMPPSTRPKTAPDLRRMAMKQSLAELVEQATTRFAEATNDMRKTAAEIRAEIELAKAEMQAGMSELPAQARRAAEDMRLKLASVKADIQKAAIDMPADARRATAEMRQELETARADSQKSVKDMPADARRAAAEIRAELEETRAELKQGRSRPAGRDQTVDADHAPRRCRTDLRAEGTVGNRWQVGQGI